YEEIDRHPKPRLRSVEEKRTLEQKCRAATRAFHRSVRDLAELEVDGDRFANANQLASRVEPLHKLGKRIDRHDAKAMAKVMTPQRQVDIFWRLWPSGFVDHFS